MRTLFQVLMLCWMVAVVWPLSAEEPPATKPVEEYRLHPYGQPPIGSLGVPLGELLLLEGNRADGGKFGASTLRIEKINGVAVSKPTGIWIENLTLPQDTPCAIYGYETFQMIDQAPAYEQLAKLNGEPQPSLPQAV